MDNTARWRNREENTVRGKRRRRLNPFYFLSMMNREEMRDADECFFLSRHAGVDDNGQNNGWNNLTDTVRCVRCDHRFVGSPRQILLDNWCSACGTHLYDSNDYERLDFLGYELYCSRVNELTDLAKLVFRHLILGPTIGSHVDHIVSKRDGFEHAGSEQLLASPVNLVRLPSSVNLRKGAKSGMLIEELDGRYEAFISKNPAWIELIEWFETEQARKVRAGRRDFDEGKALALFFRARGYQVVESMPETPERPTTSG